MLIVDVAFVLIVNDRAQHAESVSTYGQARRAIAEELGVDPGPELQHFYADLLTVTGPAGASDPMPGRSASGVPTVLVPAAGAAVSAGAGTGSAGARTGEAVPAYPVAGAGPLPLGPAQLPTDIADFTGRKAEVDQLCGMLAGDDAAASPSAVRVAVVTGAAGLGKTALAVHAAHRVRGLFPDGQLYADLRGASAAPAEPGEVLARFLRDLGVDGGKIPADGEERAALFRTRLSGRRVLIVLDDVRDAAQARPLLPGSASCAVLATTRNTPPSVVSMRFVALGTLSGPEALELFSRVAGSGRAAAEPEATAEILAACGGLPLAVRICAARLAQRRQWPVAALAVRLRDERRRLDELALGDLEVRASFKVSYDSLSAGGGQQAGAARVFRLLGLWQGPRICLPAAAALAGESEREVAGALEALVDASLLESSEPGWYQFHDLLRLFAAERAQTEESDAERGAAVERLLHRYLKTAVTVAETASPYRYRLPGEPPLSAGSPGSVADALGWYDGKEENVVAAVRQAAAAGLHEVAWRLATAMYPFFFRRGNWADCIVVHRIAVDSARGAGARRGEAWALNNLGHGLQKLGQVEAFGCLEEALAIRRDMDDLAGEAEALISLTDAYYRLRGPREAYDHSLRHMDVLRRTGNPAVLGAGLNNHGEFCLDLGRLDEAAGCLEEALALCGSMNGHGLGYVLANLGRLHQRAGHLEEAVATLADAHRHHQATGQLMEQAQTLKYLAEAQRDIGDQDQARESLTAALALFQKLQADQEAKETRAAFASLDNPDPQADAHKSLAVYLDLVHA